MANKKIAAGVAAAAIVGVLSYLGYKVYQEISNLSFDDIDWTESLDLYPDDKWREEK